MCPDAARRREAPLELGKGWEDTSMGFEEGKDDGMSASDVPLARTMLMLPESSERSCDSRLRLSELMTY